jgi:hypothetical protein
VQQLFLRCCSNVPPIPCTILRYTGRTENMMYSGSENGSRTKSRKGRMSNRVWAYAGFVLITIVLRTLGNRRAFGERGAVEPFAGVAYRARSTLRPTCRSDRRWPVPKSAEHNPHGAERSRCQHRNDGFDTIRHDGGNAIAGTTPRSRRCAATDSPASQISKCQRITIPTRRGRSRNGASRAAADFRRN